jgi:hypothetical protein
VERAVRQGEGAPAKPGSVRREAFRQVQEAGLGGTRGLIAKLVVRDASGAHEARELARGNVDVE